MSFEPQLPSYLNGVAPVRVLSQQPLYPGPEVQARSQASDGR